MSQFWRELRTNPIYMREKGRWGEPNPLFANLNRYSPFIILGAIILGVCCGGNSLSTFFGMNEPLVVLSLLVCLPSLALQALTWAGVILTPVLTAPAVSEELKRGSWDILRIIPQPTSHILLAKLFGSLARLKIWRPMFVLSALQACASSIGTFLALGMGTGGLLTALAAVAVACGLILRPYTEIAFAAIVGMVASTFTNSGRLALVFAYGVILPIKLLNSNLLWTVLTMGLAQNLLTDEGASLAAATGTLMAPLIYLLLTAVLAAVLIHRANSAATWST